MTSPTFVNEYETAWDSATDPKTTSNFDVLAGDIVVAYGMTEDSFNVLNSPPTGTLTGVWTLEQSYTTASYCAVYLWTLLVTTTQTGVNVTFTRGNSNYFGGGVQIWRNSGGVGVSSKAQSASGDPTLTLNSVRANSAIVMVNADYTPIDATSTFVANTTGAGTFTTRVNFNAGTQYSGQAGYYADAGTAGNKTIGVTDPNGMKWGLLAVELLSPDIRTTRLYLQNSPSIYTPATKRGAWDDTASNINKRLGRKPFGPAATKGVAETNAAAAYDVLLSTFVSDPLPAAYTFTASDTIQWVYGVLESNAAADMYNHIHVYITTGDSDTVRGTLLTDDIGTSEWTTTATGDGDGVVSMAGTVAASAGDRIVVEIGYRSQNTVTTSRTGTINYGNQGGTDLADASTAVTTQPGWIQFVTAGDLFTSYEKTFYLCNSAAPYSPATYRGAWDASGSIVDMLLGDLPSGSPVTKGVAETNVNAGWDVMLARFVSAPLGIPYTFTNSDMVEWVYGALESNAAADFYGHVHIYVTTGNSDTVRGTLLTDDIGDTEWPTTAAGEGDGPHTLAGTVAASAGDRIVVEIGYRSQNTVTTSRTGTINYGNVGNTNLPDLATTVTTNPGWFRFYTASRVFPEIVKATSTWTSPSNWGQILAKLWGAGGGGGGGDNVAAGGGEGGGGGAYSEKTINITPSTGYSITVGTGGIAGAVNGATGGTGGDTYFVNTSTALAKGGTGGTGTSGPTVGVGGAAASGVGDNKYSGGNGGTGANSPGGGGGGAAGTGADGSVGADGTLGGSGAAGGAGGALYGGAGSAGGNSGAVGVAGIFPGGGGGGAGGAADVLGGVGADGIVILAPKAAITQQIVSSKANISVVTTNTNNNSVKADIATTALISTLIEDFNDNSVDTAKWNVTETSGATVREAGKLLIIAPANSTEDSEGVLQSDIVYDLTASSAIVQVLQVADVTNVYTNFYLYIDSSNYIGIGVSGANIQAIKNVAGSFSVPATAAYSKTGCLWWRIRETGGTTYWEYSADRSSWTVIHSEATPITITSLYVKFDVFEHTSDATPGIAVFDNLNITADTINAIDTMSDNFDDNSVDTTNKWVTYTSASGVINETNNRIEIDLANTTNESWAGLYSKNKYYLTGKRVFVELTSATTGNSWIDLTLSLEPLPSENFISIGVNVGTQKLQALYQVNQNDVILTEVDYVPATHKYIGLREDSGTIYWEYSTDAESWSTLHSSSAVPLPIISLYTVLDDFEYDATTSPNVHIFDNYNVAVISKGSSSKADIIVYTTSANNSKADVLSTLNKDNSSKASVARLFTDLSDNFNDNSVDSTKWNLYAYNFTETGGRMQSTLNGVAEVESEFTTLNKFILQNSSVTWETGNDFVTPNNTAYFEVINSDNNGTYVSFVIYDAGGTLTLASTVDGTNQNTVTYNAVSQRWLRIRESLGTTYWEYSSNPYSGWTTLTSVSTPGAGMLFCYWRLYFLNESGNSHSVWIDNFNFSPTSQGNSTKANFLISTTIYSQANSAKSDIKVADNIDSNSAKASIVTTPTQNLSAKADIIRSGVIQENSTKASIVVTNSDGQSAKSNIKSTLSKDSSSKASIVVTGTSETNSKANILTTYSKDNSTKASLVVTGQQQNNAMANIQVLDKVQINSTKASIIVENISNDNNSKANVLVYSSQASSTKADIVALNVTQDNSVKANVLVSGNTKDNSIKASVVVVNTYDQSAKANIVATNSSDNSTKAWIFATVRLDNSAKADILVVGNTADNLVCASIIIQYTESNDAKANILATQISNQDAKGNVLVSNNVDNNSAKANVLVVNDQNNSVKSDILVIDNPQENSNKANIIHLDEKQANSSKASVVVTNTYAQNTKANILSTYIKANSSKASIVVANNYPVSVKANILFVGNIESNSVKASVVVTNFGENQVKTNIVTTLSGIHSAKADILSQLTSYNDATANVSVIDNEYINSAKANFVVTNQLPTSSKANIVTTYSKDLSSKSSIVTTGQFPESVLANILTQISLVNQTKGNIVFTNTIDSSSKANIVVTNTNNNDGIGNIGDNLWNVAGGTELTSESEQAVGQSFVATGSKVYGIKVVPVKVPTPTDSLVLEIVSDLTGTAICSVSALSSSIPASNVNTSYVTFWFSLPGDLVINDPYYIRITRSGTRDTGNMWQMRSYATNPLADGQLYSRDNNSWNSHSDYDLKYELIYDAPSSSSVKANILNSIITSQAAKANVLVTNNQISSEAKANIIGESDNSSGANILATYTKGNSVKTNISNFGQNSSSAKASILKTIYFEDQSKANIVVTDSVNNSPVGNISSVSTFRNSSTAHIVGIEIQESSTKANIIRMGETSSNNSLADIAKTISVDGSSKANLFLIKTDNNYSKANIFTVNSVDNNSKSSLLNLIRNNNSVIANVRQVIIYRGKPYQTKTSPIYSDGNTPYSRSTSSGREVYSNSGLPYSKKSNPYSDLL